MRHRIVQVKVKPRSRTSAIEDAGDGTFVAYVKSGPVDGRANDELIELVARQFGCSKAGGLDQKRRLRAHQVAADCGRVTTRDFMRAIFPTRCTIRQRP
ncbi:MAG TPA: DUF167 domain-containing protein [Casimicrobiaceae bacterium]|nr:DUF167 domain-containing protein [Casimicrobiaceae bacterium]